MIAMERGFPPNVLPWLPTVNVFITSLSAKIPLEGVMPPDRDFPTVMISGFKLY
jgi:hypothetical protein